MFEWVKRKKRTNEVELSMSYCDPKAAREYEVKWLGEASGEFARVQVKNANEWDMRFKRRTDYSSLDRLVGYALRNGFFHLKSQYVGEVKDNYMHRLSLRVGDKEHSVTDYFGAAPEWVKEMELRVIEECTERED